MNQVLSEVMLKKNQHILTNINPKWGRLGGHLVARWPLGTILLSGNYPEMVKRLSGNSGHDRWILVASENFGTNINKYQQIPTNNN